MNKQKQTYLSPETETLVVRFEGAVLQASNRTNSANSGYDEDNDLGEI